MKTEIPMPSCPQIEMGIACAILQFPAQVCPVLASRHISASDFHDFTCRSIIGEVIGRWSTRQATDWISVSHALMDQVPIIKVTEMATGPALVSVVPEWCDQVRDYSLRRSIIKGCIETAESAVDDDGRSALASLTHQISILGQDSTVSAHSLQDGIAEVLRAFAEGETKEPIGTGWQELDRLSPIRRGDMLVIGAPAKGGKSTFALSYMAEVLKRGLPALLLSLEMPVRDICEKMLARQSSVRLDTMYARNFSEMDLSRIANANAAMKAWNCEIRADCFDLPAILAAARKAKSSRPDLALVVVDYLQLVRGPNGDSREREVAEVSRNLRLLALELDCVVVALSQLNDEGKLRESRAIGQDATAVWIISLDDESEENMRTLKIPIQRNGQSGVSCELEFRGTHAHFGGV